MKTAYLISSVVAGHCVLVGGALLIGGCGTTRGPGTLLVDPPMPPSIKVEPVDVVTPVPVPEKTEEVFKPEAKTWDVDGITTYVVGKGDTLSQIAKRYDLTVAKIMTLNNISDPSKIRIGQKLVLPGKIDIDKPAMPKKSRATSLPAGSNSYVVQAGDCLSVIAAKAGVTTKALREANGLKGDMIFVGKTLVIPGGKSIPVRTSVQPKRVSPVQNSKPPVVEVEETIDTPLVMDDFKLPDLEPELPESPGTVQTYTVKANDNVLSVASEFNVSIADLRKINNLSSAILVPGQKLIIPTKD